MSSPPYVSVWWIKADTASFMIQQKHVCASTIQLSRRNANSVFSGRFPLGQGCADYYLSNGDRESALTPVNGTNILLDDDRRGDPGRCAMIVTSAGNDKLREHYSTYLRHSLLAALILHFIVFYFTPAFEIKPYRIVFEEPMESVKLPDIIKEEPLPPPIDQPKIEISASDDGAIAPESAIPKNVWYDGDILGRPIEKSSAVQSDFTGFDEAPLLISHVSPAYPELARLAGMEGRVLLSVLVGTDGTVLEVSLLQSDVTSAMEQSAIEAARRFRFSPARQNGMPVRARISVPVVFELR
jgi:protein TonB